MKKILKAKRKHKQEPGKEEQLNINEIAVRICEILIQNNFIIQRYNSISTNSIYLKLDYGVCHSIRISDHEGKKHLSYKYNLRRDIKEKYVEDDNYTRYYYPLNDYKSLIETILNEKNLKLSEYGNIGYERLMNYQNILNQNKKGFWEKSFIVNKI